MIQGRIYEIDVFEVTSNKHNYRPSTHSWKITFHKHTGFSEVEADIPEYSFQLMDISTILSMPEHDEVKYLIGLSTAFLLH